MTEHDRVRMEKGVLALGSSDPIILSDAVRALQSTDDPGLVALHDELMKRWRQSKFKTDSRGLTKGELCDWLTMCAKEYAPQALESLRRNQHMHKMHEEDYLDLQHEMTDAIVVDFVNFCAAKQGLDLALYARDVEVT